MPLPPDPTPQPFEPMALPCGATLTNRLALAPLTNQQSGDDGVLSEDEYRWLTMRAQGGFGLTMTCAASVQAEGVGFRGQLGAHDDAHLPGLSRLARGIRDHGSLGVVQLHHGGMRALPDRIGRPPMAPSDDAETGAVAMTAAEISQVRADFVAAAVRAERAGFGGVELHGAHGYLLCQFLSPELNRRQDDYGGSLDNRARLLLEVVEGVRAATQPGFAVGVRLSPERFGLRLQEIVEVARRLLAGGQIDFLDMSLWDVTKEPNEPEFVGRTLASYFTELDRGAVQLGAAGKVGSGAEIRALLAAGFDFAVIGRAAILHHDLPQLLADDPDFAPVALPVSEARLQREGLGPVFVDYMRRWAGFVSS